MENIEESKKLLQQLEAQLKNIDKWIREKEKEKAKFEEDLYKSFNEKAELEEILKKCNADVCKYKIAFEHIKDKYAAGQKRVSEQKFHFFLSYQGKYAQSGFDVIKSHQNIIEQKGFCWWAKFFKERTNGSIYRELEPFGESIRIDEKSVVPHALRKRVEQRVNSSDNVYLFIYNPNPPDIKLHVANVTDFCYGEETIPYQDEHKTDLPSCAYVPDYYFYKGKRNCVACKKADPKKCPMHFLSNFWFKIDRITELKNVKEEFTNLTNCFTNDTINFAVPILYPLLVTQSKEKLYFGETKSPVEHAQGFSLEIPSAERGHTKTEKVHNFFKALNSLCGDCFVRVESIGCLKPYSSQPELMEGGKDDEIFVYLPGEFRGDGKGTKFKISLDKNTTANQKETVKKLISSCPK